MVFLEPETIAYLNIIRYKYFGIDTYTVDTILYPDDNDVEILVGVEIHD